MRFLLLLALCFTILPPAAHADSKRDKARAREVNRKAMTRYELGDYDSALVLFKNAYEIYADPKIFFNIAQTHRKKRDWAPALESYRLYLQNLPQAENRAAVEEIIHELEGLQAAEQQSNGKPPAGVTSAPAAEPIAAPPPVVSAPAAPMKDAAATPADTRPPTRWYKDKVGWSLAGAGLLVAGIGTGLILHADGQAGDLDTAPEGNRDGLVDGIHRNRVLGGIGLGLGGALIAAGVVKLVLTERAAHGATVVVTAGGVALRGSF